MHTMLSFLGLYKQFLELRNKQISFNNEELRKTTVHKAVLSRAAALHDAELVRAALLGDTILENEKAKGSVQSVPVTNIQ